MQQIYHLSAIRQMYIIESKYKNVFLLQTKNWILDLIFIVKLFPSGETVILFKMLLVASKTLNI